MTNTTKTQAEIFSTFKGWDNRLTDALATNSAAAVFKAIQDMEWSYSAREAAGSNRITFGRGADVVVDRYPSRCDCVMLLIVPAQFEDYLGGDSIRDGDAPARMVSKPMRVAVEIDLEPEEMQALGLA